MLSLVDELCKQIRFPGEDLLPQRRVSFNVSGHIFGASAGSSNLAGKDNTFIATFFQNRFVVHGQKLDAQVLATALAVYVTDGTLDNTGVGTQYGFTVSGNGDATATYNVGTNGVAFGLADNNTMIVMDLLLAAEENTSGYQGRCAGTLTPSGGTRFRKRRPLALQESNLMTV